MQSFFLVRACQMQRSQPLSVVPCRQLSICVKVNRSDSGKTGGQWMLSAESPDGKVSYSRIGKYVTPMEVTQ